MLVFIYGLFVIGSAIYFFLTWNHKHWAKRGIPFAEPSVLYGNFPSTLTQKRNIAYEHDEFYNQFKDRYNFVGCFSLRQPQYFILDAGVARDILISKFKNFHDNEFSDMIDKIKAMYPVIDDVCESLKKFIQRGKHSAINARDLCENFTTDVVSSCIYGADARALSGEKAPIREMGKKLFGTTPKIVIYFLAVQFIPSITKFVKIGFVPKNVEKFFVKLTKDAIDLRRKSNITREDYLTYLLELQAKKGISELSMASHAISFFLDGFITSSVVLSFTFYELAKSKRVQDKLRTEIRETIAKHGRITFEIAQEMPYLEQVVSENLRLNPPLSFINKKCTETCELPLTETKSATIEEGYGIILPVRSIQRDSRYYENPNDFIPERFAPEKGGTKVYKDKGCYMPFGDGPRICLGMRFAHTQMKAAIIAIVKDFEISLDPKTSPNGELDPKDFIPDIIGGIWLRFKEIKE
uniref:Cytochrome n=1 Tax=Lutzomyia longipalpis TaxID=7200 RepID=A0A1B0CTA7_LUTLO